MTPNDLMDTRDNLLDQLSSKFGIDVDRDKDETINVTASESGIEIDSVKKLVASSPNDEYLRFSYINDVKVEKDGSGNPTGDLTLTYNKLGDDTQPVTITVTCTPTKAEETAQKLLEARVVMTDSEGTLTQTDGTAVNSGDSIAIADLEEVMFSTDNKILNGEIAGNQAAQDSIQKSMDELDKLAISLAYTVNAIQTGTTDSATVGLKYSDGSAAEMIFVVKDGTTDTGINAKNISLNTVIKNDSSKLICGEDISDVSGDKAGTRALAIAGLSSLKIDYTKFDIDGITRDGFFTGTGIDYKDSTIKQDLATDKEGSTIKDYYIKITSNLGIELKSVKGDLTTAAGELESYEEQRLSVSGVSLDEEMTDLIKFQHAYQANAKMINTIDQLLDVVINGLKA